MRTKVFCFKILKEKQRVIISKCKTYKARVKENFPLFWLAKNENWFICTLTTFLTLYRHSIITEE